MSDVSLQRQLDNAWLEVKNAESKLDAANIEIARLRECLETIHYSFKMGNVVSGPMLETWAEFIEKALNNDEPDEMRNERERLMKKLEKIENLSKHAWEQVDKNPAEAQELFRMIYAESK